MKNLPNLQGLLLPLPHLRAQSIKCVYVINYSWYVQQYDPVCIWSSEIFGAKRGCNFGIQPKWTEHSPQPPPLKTEHPPPLDYVFDQWSILLLKVMAWAQELTDLYRVFCEQENQSITIWKIEVYIVVEFPTMKIIIILFPFNMNSLIVFLNLEKSAKVNLL